MGYARRQLITALLTANAVRPVRGRLAALGFAFGWPTGELAPQLLALTALDTAQAVLRGKASRTGLLLAGASAAGLGYLMPQPRRSAELAEVQLAASLGPDYLDHLPSRPVDADLQIPLRDLAKPFTMAKPDVEVIRNINYREGGSRARLDIYRPKGVDLADAPVLV